MAPQVTRAECSAGPGRAFPPVGAEPRLAA